MVNYHGQFDTCTVFNFGSISHENVVSSDVRRFDRSDSNMKIWTACYYRRYRNTGGLKAGLVPTYEIKLPKESESNHFAGIKDHGGMIEKNNGYMRLWLLLMSM